MTSGRSIWLKKKSMSNEGEEVKSGGVLVHTRTGKRNHPTEIDEEGG